MVSPSRVKREPEGESDFTRGSFSGAPVHLVIEQLWAALKTVPFLGDQKVFPGQWDFGSVACVSSKSRATFQFSLENLISLPSVGILFIQFCALFCPGPGTALNFDAFKNGRESPRQGAQAESVLGLTCSPNG